MFVRLLGEIGIGPDETHVRSAPGQIASAVLAHLALSRGRLVSADHVVEAVWDEPPESARNSVQVAVSKLRKQFGADLVFSDRHGYRLPTTLLRLDWFEADSLVSQARRLLADGRLVECIAATGQARELFSGEPLMGLRSSSALSARNQAADLLTTIGMVQGRALLELGRAGDAVDVLRVDVSREPLNEPLHALLMDVLGAAGRPADGLAVYAELRRRLADELGVDPAPSVADAFARLLKPARTDTAEPRGGTSDHGMLRLPAVAGPLIGRESEVARLTEQFESGRRLLSLVGPGGIGKTRLALAVARETAARDRCSAIFVDLTGARDRTGVEQAIGNAVSPDGEDIGSTLRGTRTLVVIDNAEHVLEAAIDGVRELLGVDGVRVLVTSRSRMKMRDERVLWLDPLRTEGPAAPALTLLTEAAGLSADEACEHSTKLQELTLRADGVPLVLELLAAALRWASPEELTAQVDRTLLELVDEARDRPARHLSLDAATVWSLRNVGAESRAALGALTVARASFSLVAAVEMITAGQSGEPRRLLAELVDSSLVRRLPDPGRIRFRMLEPIRLIATASDLVPLPDPAVHQAHAAHYLGPVLDADGQSDAALLELFAVDDANVQAALEWSWANQPDQAMEYLGAVLYAWHQYRSRYAEVRQWGEMALATGVGNGPARARVVVAMMYTATWLLDSELVATIPRDVVVDVFDDLGGEWRRRWLVCETARLQMEGDIDGAIALMERLGAMATTPRDRIRAAQNRVVILLSAGRFAEASVIGDDLLTWPELPDHPVLRATALNNSGYLSIVLGRYDKARVVVSDGLQLCDDMDLHGEAAQLRNNLSWITLEQGSPLAALRIIADSLSDTAVQADRAVVAEGLVIAGFSVLHVRPHQANALAEAAADILRGSPGMLDPWLRGKIDELFSRSSAGTDDERSAAVDDLIRTVLAAGSS